MILPGLSREYSTESATEFRHTLDWAIKMILVIGVPAGLALLILAEPILVTLFQYGALSPRDVDMAALSLRAMALGLPAFMLIKVLATAYYSRQDTATPVAIGIKAMVANMVMNLMFVIPLHMLWQVGHAGLALATTGAAYLNAGLLLRGLLKREIYRPEAGFGADLGRIAGAALAMSIGLAFALPWLGELGTAGWWQRAGQLAAVCVGGVILYFAALLLSHPRFLRRPG